MSIKIIIGLKLPEKDIWDNYVKIKEIYSYFVLLV